MISELRPMEHFNELVTSAMERQKVEADDLARFYLASLLAGFIKSARLDNEPLANKYMKALGSRRVEQAQLFKELGDLALFISGFFSDSLNRKIIDIDYYILMGASSYGQLVAIYRGSSGAPLVPLFSELEEKFAVFVNVLAEVSERSRLTTSRDILRVYERWLKTRSGQAENILRDLGISPIDVGSDPVN